MGKGGGGGGQTTSTSYQTNIPEYARPYVETMLGATQQQLFQGNKTPVTTDPETGQTTGGQFEITGFKPYQAYGGTYDKEGNAVLGPDGKPIYDAGKSIAGFQRMQTDAQKGIAGLQMPGEFGQASGITQAAAQNAQNMGYQGNYARNQFQGPAQYQNAQFGMQQAQAPNLQNYQMQGPADVQSQGYDAATMQGAQTGFGPNLQNYQMGPAERVSAQNFGGQSAQDYMSPYMQNVVDVQQREAQRTADIAGTQRGANAARSGAFGGSRQAVMDAEAARNLSTQKGDIQAQGLQAAYGQAQQQFNADQARQMAAQQANQGAGLTVGQQNLGANLGIQQLGTQTGAQMSLANLSNEQQASVQNQAAQNQARGMNSQQAMQAALANQQSGLTTGQQNLSANLGIQQLGAGQDMQAQLANQQAYQTAQQAAEQSRQYGYGQNMNAAQQRAQYGLAANQLNAQQQQFGATYGQNANAQALAAANQLAGIGQQGLTAQQGIYGMQNQVGAQQQALEQQKINQAMTDYANAQQYPLMQLGTMSNMLRGLPMQAQTTSQYQAAPNALTQGIGAVGAYGALNNAGMFGTTKTSAEGGVIKSYASGGITSYDVGGAVEADLEDMDIDGLQRQVKESSSPRIKQMAQRILAEKKMAAPRMAGGGIIAFAKGDQVEDEFDGMQMATADDARDPRVVSDAEPLPNEGIMMAAATPRPAPKTPAPAPVATTPTAPAPEPVDAFANAQKDQAAQQKVANTSLADLVAEDKALRKSMGVDTSPARETYRAEQMAERANLKDEAERQRQMRLAEFFASWGSTPGSTLAAGMNALKKSIPGMVDDQKEAKRLKRESDKILFDIDEATRLEELGFIDRATAKKEKASTHAQELNKQILTAQTQRIGYEKQLEGTKITADRMVRSQEGTAARADQRGQETQRYNFQRTEQEAKKAVANLEAQIAKEAKDNTAYVAAKRVAESTVRGDQKGKEKARATVNEVESSWKARREAANSDLTLARDQLNEINKGMGIGVKKNDNSGKDGAPTKRPSLDDPSLQRTQ